VLVGVAASAQQQEGINHDDDYSAAPAPDT
jgi:hypothetical protein